MERFLGKQCARLKRNPKLSSATKSKPVSGGNGNQRDDEYVADLQGEMEMPVRGHIIVRNGNNEK